MAISKMPFSKVYQWLVTSLSEKRLSIVDLAAKFSGDNADEYQGRVAELNLAMVWPRISVTILF